MARMRQQLNRLAPRLPAGRMKTYSITSPLPTHWRKATCAEVDCPAYASGWKSLIDESTELGQKQAHYIRKQSGRGFTEQREGALTAFVFEAGQPCFGADAHKLPTGRPELFKVRGGDWRGNPRGESRTHTRAADWVDDFANHQQALADRLARG